MGILGTSKTEEEALRAAAPQNQMNRLDSSSSLNASASSAYETASEFDPEDLNSEHAEQQHNTGNDQQTYNEAEDASTIQDVDPNAHLRAAELKDDKSSSGPEYAGTGDDEPENDENAVWPVQDDAFFMNRDMTEDQLNRIASTRTERSMAASVVQSIQRGEPVKVADLDYDSPDDKDNPHNWPAWKKWAITFIIANSCLCITLGSSLYVEGVPELMEKFNMSQTLGLSGLTFYLIGLAVGPVIGAPVSEIFGRRWVYVTTFPAAILFTMGVGLSQNAYSVLILRFFSGLVASPPLSIAGGSIMDMWANAPEQMSTAMAMFCLSPFLGPVVGPIIGGFAAEHKNWRWTLWISMMFYGLMLPFVLWAPETFKTAILVKRAKKRGVNVIIEIPSFKEMMQVHLVRPIEMLFVEPIVGLSSLYIAFVFAVLFGFFEAFPIIFRGVYRMDTGVSGLPFIGVGVGLLGAVIIFLFLDKFYYFPKNPDGTRGRRDDEGKLIMDAPESRLLVVKFGAVLLPIGLFWLAWTSRRSVHWIVPTLAGVPFGCGLLWVFFGVILYYSMSFPPAYVASALAANNLLRYVVASVFPLFTVQMYNRLHIDWATSLFAFVALAMVPIPFVFDIWGKQLRSRSKYGYLAMFKKMAEQRAAAEAHHKSAVSHAPNNNIQQTTSNSQDVAEKV